MTINFSIKEDKQLEELNLMIGKLNIKQLVLLEKMLEITINEKTK